MHLGPTSAGAAALQNSGAPPSLPYSSHGASRRPRSVPRAHQTGAEGSSDSLRDGRVPLPQPLFLDPNEEKVKRVPKPRPASVEMLAGASAAGLGVLASSPPPAVAEQVFTPLDISYGQPNELLVNVLHFHAEQAEKDSGIAGHLTQLRDHLKELASQHLPIPEQVSISSLDNFPEAAIPSSLQPAFEQLSEQLAVALRDMPWPIPAPAAQTAAIAGAALGVAVLVGAAGAGQGRSSSPAPAAATASGGTTGPTSTSAWGLPNGPGAAPTSSPSNQSAFAPRATPGTPNRGASMGPSGVSAGTSSQMQSAGSSRVGTGGGGPGNPVQQAWQQYRSQGRGQDHYQPQPPPASTQTGNTSNMKATGASTPPKAKENNKGSSSKASGSMSSARSIPMRTIPLRATPTHANPSTTLASSNLSASVGVGMSGVGEEDERAAAAQRQVITDKLKLISVALGPLLSVVPGGDSAREYADILLSELEILAPATLPLNTQQAMPTGRGQSRVLGTWRLIYATNDHHHLHRQPTNTAFAAAPTYSPAIEEVTEEVVVTETVVMSGPTDVPVGRGSTGASNSVDTKTAKGAGDSPDFIQRLARQHLASIPRSGPTPRPIGKPNPWAKPQTASSTTVTTPTQASATSNATSFSAPSKAPVGASQLGSNAGQVGGSGSLGATRPPFSVGMPPLGVGQGDGKPHHPPPGGLGSDVVTALLHLAAVLPGFGLESVEQRLWEDGRQDVVSVCNSAVFNLGPFGQWRVAASGGWRLQGDGHTAVGWFESVSLRPVSFLGIDASAVPAVEVSLPASLQSTQIRWDTTYLDTEYRISRADTGTVFLFQKAEDAAMEDTALYEASSYAV